MKRLEKARMHVQDELLQANSNTSSLTDCGVMEFYLAPSTLN